MRGMLVLHVDQTLSIDPVHSEVGEQGLIEAVPPAFLESQDLLAVSAELAPQAGNVQPQQMGSALIEVPQAARQQVGDPAPVALLGVDDGRVHLDKTRVAV